MHIPPETIDWLMEGDPAIRHQVMRDLLDEPPATCERQRALVATEGWGARLLALQDEEGTWAGGLYGPKWTSTTYTLLLLRRCGVPANERLSDAVALLFDGARYSRGGLTPAVESPAPEGCVTAMYVMLARYYGYEDRRVDDAIEWLLANQLEDGGWNCRHVHTGDRHSSFHTSISTLEALDEVSRSDDDPRLEPAMEGGREFFLAHRLFKSHQTGEVVDQKLTMFSFPPRWHYDVLRGLEHFAATASTWDSRFTDALELLRSKRREHDRWPVQNKHPGNVWFDMETGREPSRWNTLRAFRVLRWVEAVGP